MPTRECQPDQRREHARPDQDQQGAEEAPPRTHPGGASPCPLDGQRLHIRSASRNTLQVPSTPSTADTEVDIRSLCCPARRRAAAECRSLAGRRCRSSGGGLLRRWSPYAPPAKVPGEGAPTETTFRLSISTVRATRPIALIPPRPSDVDWRERQRSPGADDEPVQRCLRIVQFRLQRDNY